MVIKKDTLDQLDTSIYGAPDAVAMSEARVFVPAQGSYIR
jgi:hypothetical protein